MELDNNRKVEIIIGLFLLGGIITWLVIPMSFQDTTIILEGGNGGSNTTSGVNTLTSANGAIAFNATNGNVLLTPKYQLLCQDIASSGDTSLDCNNFTAKKNLKVDVYYRVQTSSASFNERFNGDSGNNYSYRFSNNGAADTTSINQNICLLTGNLNAGQSGYIAQNIDNHIASAEKVVYSEVFGQIGTGAGNLPFRFENACKWANTANQITSINFVRISGTGTMQEGSLSVWGYD